MHFPVVTPHGPAEVRVDLPAGPPALLLVLGHGAGGNVDAPDLVAVRDAVLGLGAAVARVTQPYRVAGRRAPAPAGQLDTAWVAAVAAVVELPELAALPLVVGGRSSGARVACRTAAATGARGIVALAFPLHPPGKPDRSRAAELATGLPTLVVNGDRDPFGIPVADGTVTVEVMPGADHALQRDVAAVAAAVTGWLGGHGWPLPER
ncbi:MAG TPA: alpha/beta family hydrolase [Mycobacteriales bacterium]|nr:alpha/beta family hydrolase [Mycobacteriales bacterium]